MPRGKKKVRHMIDGREMTVDEIAAMLGVTVHTLQVRRCALGGVSYQLIVNMYKNNQIGSVHDKVPRHLVDGEWLTVRQAAERVGVSPITIHHWRQSNPGATLADAMAHYRRYQTGELKRWPGAVARKHYVLGKYLTIAEAAEQYRTTEPALRCHMYKHRCSLHAAVKALEERRKRQAEKDILAILAGKGKEAT